VLVKGLSASAGGGGDRKHGFRGGGCHGRRWRARRKRGRACARRSAAALNRGVTSCFGARRWTVPWYGGLGTTRTGRQWADRWATASAAGGERVARGRGFRGDLGVRAAWGRRAVASGWCAGGTGRRVGGAPGAPAGATSRRGAVSSANVLT
jgi:hypothetical protein